jgi:hypothetical protein
MVAGQIERREEMSRGRNPVTVEGTCWVATNINGEMSAHSSQGEAEQQGELLLETAVVMAKVRKGRVDTKVVVPANFSIEGAGLCDPIGDMARAHLEAEAAGATA